MGWDLNAFVKHIHFGLNPFPQPSIDLTHTLQLRDGLERSFYTTREYNQQSKRSGESLRRARLLGVLWI